MRSQLSFRFGAECAGFYLDRADTTSSTCSTTSARVRLSGSRTPGRPRTVSTIRTEEAPPDGYRPLAALLAANLGPTPRTRRHRAEKAGRDWATNLVPPTDHTVDTDDAARRVAVLFAEMNFDPELVDSDSGTQRQIRLRACPYRDVARDHPDVVCAIHLGLLRGALSQLGNPPITVRLVPFVKPHLCMAYLTPELPSGDASAPPSAKS